MPTAGRELSADHAIGGPPMVIVTFSSVIVSYSSWLTFPISLFLIAQNMLEFFPPWFISLSIFSFVSPMSTGVLFSHASSYSFLGCFYGIVGYFLFIILCFF